MTKLKTPFFHILLSIVNETSVDWSLFNLFTPRDWEFFYALSKRQGVVAIIFEAIKSVPKEMAPPKAITLRWISHALSIEDQMKKKRVLLSSLRKNYPRDIFKLQFSKAWYTLHITLIHIIGNLVIWTAI